MEIASFRKHLAPGDASQTRFSLFSMLCRNHQVIVSDCSQTCQDIIQESNFPSTKGCVCVCVYTLILSAGDVPISTCFESRGAVHA